MAEVALLDDRNQGVNISGIVRAGGKAVFASDAPSEILDDDPVFTTVGGLCRTYCDAWSLITMHTRHRDEFGIHLRIFPVGHGNDLVPKNISSFILFIRRSMWDIVLRLTGR